MIPTRKIIFPARTYVPAGKVDNERGVISNHPVVVALAKDYKTSALVQDDVLLLGVVTLSSLNVISLFSQHPQHLWIGICLIHFLLDWHWRFS